MTDSQVEELVRAVAARARRLLDGGGDGPHAIGGHRGVMAAVMTAVVAASDPASPVTGEAALVRHAADRVTDLAALQAASGLFTSGDNVESPPDSAFTINAAVTTVRLLRRPGVQWPDELADRLEALVRAAAPALRGGGVHTPNHRWELASALARSGALLGEPLLAERARLWLAEGIDVDEDGLYSERSPNYAAHVSNPALTALGDLLDRPDLHEVVHRNLHAHLDLTDSAGQVETVGSRRQDQYETYPLGTFLGQLRRAAIRHACLRCAHGARHAAAAGGVDAAQVRAEQLLDPALAGPLPDGPDPGRPARRLFGRARLLRDTRRSGVDITVHGGSDVPAAGRIGSGLACNPTFLRLRLGDVAVESLRLSRDFFGLGPFRAAEMVLDEDRVLLGETVGAAYYQPLPAAARRADGRYELGYEGRYSAAMSFPQRPRDLVELETRITVHLRDDGVDLVVGTDGPAAAHSLEIALPAGGVLDGALPLGDDRFELVEGWARFRRGGHVLTVGPVRGSGPRQPPGYLPGEVYTSARGTDALGGLRLYVTWRSPATTSVSLRVARAAAVG